MSALVWTEIPLYSGEMSNCTKWEADCPWDSHDNFRIFPTVDRNALLFTLYPDYTHHATADAAKAEAQRQVDEYYAE